MNENSVKLMIRALKNWTENCVSNLSSKIKQPNWNQNDPSAADYIKNRPFYKETTTTYEKEKTWILKPVNLEFDENNYTSIIFDCDITQYLEIGTEMIVNWNGVEHKCSVFREYITYQLMVGNGTIIYYRNDDTGEPFVINLEDGYFQSNDASPVTVSVYKLSDNLVPVTRETITKIPEEYLDIKEIEVDAELDETSSNPISNKAVSTAINNAVSSIKQSNWNQNDSVEPDYIIDRPVYKENISIYKNDDTVTYAGLTYIHCFDMNLTTNDLLGARIWGSGEFESTDINLTLDDITEYDWGIDFKYGFVLINGPVTISDTTFETPGVYLKTYCQTLSTSYVAYYATYKLTLTLYHRLDNNYLNLDTKLDIESENPVQNKVIAPILNDLIKIPTEFVLKDITNGYNYILQMDNGTLTSICACSEIRIDQMPINMNYTEGDSFDPTGMIITVVSEDGTTREVTNYTYTETIGSDGIVNIIYKEGRQEYTVSININVTTVEDLLVDFNYTKNTDGTYTLTEWKQTLNGVSSTEMVIPNNKLIIVEVV